VDGAYTRILLRVQPLMAVICCRVGGVIYGLLLTVIRPQRIAPRSAIALHTVSAGDHSLKATITTPHFPLPTY
jgi:hypothetical protein